MTTTYEDIVNKIKKIKADVLSTDGHLMIENRMAKIYEMIESSNISEEQRQEAENKLKEILKENSDKFNGKTMPYNP